MWFDSHFLDEESSSWREVISGRWQRAQNQHGVLAVQSCFGLVCLGVCVRSEIDGETICVARSSKSVACNKIHKS